jgi:chromosome segregation ATPase
METRNTHICGYLFSIRFCETMAVMSDAADNIVLEHLRHIRVVLDNVHQDVRELKTRVGILEQQYASMSNRIDRIEYRLERIESRIGLIEA